MSLPLHIDQHIDDLMEATADAQTAWAKAVYRQTDISQKNYHAAMVRRTNRRTELEDAIQALLGEEPSGVLLDEPPHHECCGRRNCFLCTPDDPTLNRG